MVSLFLLVLTVNLSAQGDENLYEAGRKAFAGGLYVMAVRSFRQLVEQYPDSLWADDSDYLRALAHYYLGEPGACVEVLSGFSRRHPGSPHSRRISYWLALSYIQQGRHREARDSLTTQITGYPDERELLEQSLLLRGMAEETLGLWREAAASYRALLERSSARAFWAETLFRLGGVELRVGGYAGALSAFTRILVEFPESPQAAESLFYAAEAYYSLGKPAEAERRYLAVLSGAPSLEQRETALFRLVGIRSADRRFQEALAAAQELEGSFPRTRFAEQLAVLKANLFFDLERFDKAYLQYQTALKQHRQQPERQLLLFNLGLSALSAGSPERAIGPLREALEGPDQGAAEESGLRLGMALGELGRDGEAIDALESFRRRFPASGKGRDATKLLGSLYARNGQHRDAVEAYSRLLALDPFEPTRDELLFRRGASRLAAGDENGALKDFFVVLESPSSAFRAESLYNLGYVYTRRGEFARAQSYFKDLLAASPSSELKGRAVLAAGTSSFNAGDYEQALKWFLQNTDGVATPWSGDSWLYLGRTYYRLDRLREAATGFAAAARLLDGTAKGEESMFWEGLALFRLNDLEQAQRRFRSLTVRYPEGRRAAEAYYRSGMCAALAGRYDESLEELSRARARLGPRTEEYNRSLEQEILYQRATSLLKSGRREQAKDGFQELAQRYPDADLAAEGFFALAEADFRSGQFGRAFQGFLQVTERFPKHRAGLEALYWAGDSAVRAGEREQGLEYLARYLESSSGGGLARAATEEIRTVLSSLARDPESPALTRFYRRAESSRALEEGLKNQVRYEYASYLFNRDRPEALVLLERIRSSSPAEPLAGQVNLLIGEHYRLSGDFDRALDIFHGITGAGSQASAASAQLAIARILEDRARGGVGSIEEAADEYLKTYFVYPDFREQAQEGLYQAGRLFWREGKRDRARRLFEKLKSEFPDSRWLEELPAQ